MNDANKVSVETKEYVDIDQPDLTMEEPDQNNLEVVTDKWKRALAEAENARKRADMARFDGREHGIALAIEALAPAYDTTWHCRSRG